MAEQQHTEVWKQITDFPNYSVSSLGRVKKTAGYRPGKIISPQIEANGYHRLNLYRDDKMFRVTLHRIVAIAFHERLSDNLQVNHKDGNKNDNSAANLEWVTASENVKHRFRVLGHKASWGSNPRRGSRHGMAKITEDIVRAIRMQLCDGVPQSQIAREFGISQSNVSLIHRGEAWAHVT